MRVALRGTVPRQTDLVPVCNSTVFAAEQGHIYAAAQTNLGLMFADLGAERDWTEAWRLLRLAAAQGLADAFLNMGVIFCTTMVFPRPCRTH